MNDKLEKIRTISNRLARSLAVLVAIFIPGALFAYTHPGSIVTSPPMACFIVGVIGGFVGLQRRLKKCPMMTSPCWRIHGFIFASRRSWAASWQW
jgi:hypothetical protein